MKKWLKKYWVDILIIIGAIMILRPIIPSFVKCPDVCSAVITYPGVRDTKCRSGNCSDDYDTITLGLIVLLIGSDIGIRKYLSYKEKAQPHDK